MVHLRKRLAAPGPSQAGALCRTRHHCAAGRMRFESIRCCLPFASVGRCSKHQDARMNKMRCTWILFPLLTLGLCGAEVKTPPWEKSPLIAGRDLFRENCAVCHDIDKDQKQTRKFGPSLNHLFKNDKLPL